MSVLIKKPMLAETLECESISVKWPVLATPKLDGIRCIVINGKALSRTLKPIPNQYIRETIEKFFAERPEAFDGEIMVGKTFQECTSGVMTRTGTPEFKFHVFDVVADDKKKPYADRVKDMRNILDSMNYLAGGFIEIINPKVINNEKNLLLMESELLELGYEGVMIRSPNSPYKEGRSTLKEEYLLKVKRYSQDEAKIIGYEELMHNNNEAEISETGNTKRSSHQENLVPASMLGAFIVEAVKSGIQFKIGTGLTELQRTELWETKEDLIGKIVTFKYFPIGVLEKPRHPVFIGFRHPDDISE